MPKNITGLALILVLLVTLAGSAAAKTRSADSTVLQVYFEGTQAAFAGLPAELSEAARVDGASEFRIYAQIIIPLSRPALATTALFTFLYTYTDFLNPLIYISDPDRFTLSLGLLGFFGSHGAAWGPLLAASAMFTLPTVIFFLVAQRTFIQGIATTGVKG